MFEKIIQQIERYDSIVLFGHIHPDGDCYGAQIGLKQLIKERYPNKKVFAVGTGLPDFFEFISPMDEVSDDVIKDSLAIILDGNDLTRSEDKRIYLAKAFAKIDHHIDLHSFKEGPEVISESANSTCELIVEFAKENNMEISKLTAKALYLGLITDTGRFQFCVDFEKVFSISSELISKGAEPYEMYKILNMRPESYLKIVGYIYSHYKKMNPGILYMTFTKEEVAKFGEETYDVANYVKLIGNVKDYKVWVFFVERNDGKMVCEFRSNDYNVQSVAAKYGGGGHAHAAGVTVDRFGEDIINLILNDLKDLIS